MSLGESYRRAESDAMQSQDHPAPGAWNRAHRNSRSCATLLIP
jgi:hypothetical protein